MLQQRYGVTLLVAKNLKFTKGKEDKRKGRKKKKKTSFALFLILRINLSKVAKFEYDSPQTLIFHTEIIKLWGHKIIHKF